MKHTVPRSYEAESLENQLAGIRALHLTARPEHILREIVQKQDSLITDLLNQNPWESEFWLYVGRPQIVQALKDAYALSVFREALESEHFAYITNGHKVSPHYFHCYHRDNKSPTGVCLKASIDQRGEIGAAAKALIGQRRISTSRSYA